MGLFPQRLGAGILIHLFISNNKRQPALYEGRGTSDPQKEKELKPPFCAAACLSYVASEEEEEREGATFHAAWRGGLAGSVRTWLCDKHFASLLQEGKNFVSHPGYLAAPLVMKKKRQQACLSISSSFFFLCWGGKEKGSEAVRRRLFPSNPPLLKKRRQAWRPCYLHYAFSPTNFLSLYLSFLFLWHTCLFPSTNFDFGWLIPT